MPNTAVKPLYAESTRLETVREDRELPVKKIPHLLDAEFFLCQRRIDTQMRGHLLSAVYRCPLTAKRVLHAFCSTLFAYFGITKNLMKAMV